MWAFNVVNKYNTNSNIGLVLLNFKTLKMNIQTKFRYAKQKIVNRFNTDYEKNLIQAQRYTDQLGLTPINFTYNPSFEQSTIVKKEVGEFLSQYFYTHKQLNLEHMAGRCMIRSREAQEVLKKHFNIDSIITNGWVCDFNYIDTFQESKSIIEKRLKREYLGTIGFHSWLTLPNYDVIDVTILPYIWFRDDKKSSTESRYKGTLWSQPLIERKPFLYKPVFLGYEYFEKVPMVAELHEVELLD